MNEYLINQIKKIPFMSNGTVIEINNENGCGFLYKGQLEYAIAIPYDYKEDISEEFVGISLSTNFLNYGKTSIKVLYLHASNTIDVDKFAYVGAHFLDNSNRDKILFDPCKWVDEWKEIFGDSIKHKMIYDVIGELISLKYIYENDKTAKWEGPNKGTHDIVTSRILYEVKSTQKKNDSNITINSAFQLSPNQNEKLYFCRLELKPYTNSINSLVEDLVSMGYDETELEMSLQKLGYKKGSRIRSICYEALEIRSYDVNEDNFPIISIEDVNALGPKNNIINYTLSLDLNCIEFIKIK